MLVSTKWLEIVVTPCSNFWAPPTCFFNRKSSSFLCLHCRAHTTPHLPQRGSFSSLSCLRCYHGVGRWNNGNRRQEKIFTKFILSGWSIESAQTAMKSLSAASFSKLMQGHVTPYQSVCAARPSRAGNFSSASETLQCADHNQRCNCQSASQGLMRFVEYTHCLILTQAKPMAMIKAPKNELYYLTIQWNQNTKIINVNYASST